MLWVKDRKKESEGEASVSVYDTKSLHFDGGFKQEAGQDIPLEDRQATQDVEDILKYISQKAEKEETVVYLWRRVPDSSLLNLFLRRLYFLLSAS